MEKNLFMKTNKLQFKIYFSDIKRLKKSEKWFALFSNRCTDKELEEIAMNEPAIKKLQNIKHILCTMKNFIINTITRKSYS